MKDIKGKKIAVLCDTEKKIEDMMKAIGKENMIFDAKRRNEYYSEEKVCQNVTKNDGLDWCRENWYIKNGYQIISFDEFMETEGNKEYVNPISKYSAEENLGWLMDNYSDTNKYDEVFGSDYLFNKLVESFAPSEIIRRVSAQLDKENQLTTISKSSYDKIATEQLNKLYPNGWKVKE